MGAGCSSAKSVQVAPGAVVKKVSDQAQEHLKNLQSEDPLAKTSNDSLALSTALAKLQGINGREGEDAADLDEASKNYGGLEGTRLHEPLWKAIEANDLNKAAKFLDLNEIEEQNMYDGQGQSMVHRTCQLGNVEMLMLLLERTGAKPEVVNKQLATPLHLAVRNNQLNIVKFLIGCGVDCNSQDEHGQTPLLISVIHGHSEIASTLVESSIAGHLPELLETDLGDHRGLTPLNCAAIRGDLSLIKILIQRGLADPNQTSPKGCTALIYAGRGGYSEVVRYLLDKRASPLKQDNAGGTVLHHAIEKGHMAVLEVLLESGVDIYSAIEIADNAGRTPLFEAVSLEIDNVSEEDLFAKQVEIIELLAAKRKRQGGGYGAKVSVLNYNGQSPLFAAVKSGNLEAVRSLIKFGAAADLTGGELVKEEDQSDTADESAGNGQEESVAERCFMEAFMNCCTPLQVASVLGYDEIAALLLSEGKADVDYQSPVKRYNACHLAVLANKPEMLIELLTRTEADPLQEDSQGRTLLDLVYQYQPHYVDSFQNLLENLQNQRIQSQNSDGAPTVAKHFVDPNDERKLTGVNDAEQIKKMFAADKEISLQAETNNHDHNGAADRQGGFLSKKPGEMGVTQRLKKTLQELDESEIVVEEDGEMHPKVELFFGRKIALGLIAADWKYKEMAIAYVYKQLQKALAKSELNFALKDLVEASVATVSVTAQERVMKVFNVCLNLFNTLVASSKIDQDSDSINVFVKVVTNDRIVLKFLQKSEESNTRLTNKIHEALLDLSYHPKVGENLVAQAILDQIGYHHSQKQTNQKGLLAQLALLFKMVNSFEVFDPRRQGDTKKGDGSSSSALTVESVLQAAIPGIAQTNQDVKNTAIKIVLDVQRLTGSVMQSHLVGLPDRTREMLKEKIAAVQCETDFNATSTKNRNGNDQTQAQGAAGATNSLSEMLEAGKLASNLSIVNNSEDSAANQINSQGLTREQQLKIFERSIKIVEEKGSSKEWTQREIALLAVQESFENASAEVVNQNEAFLTQCINLLKTSLEENNIQLYLLALQAGSIFLQKSLQFEIVRESLPGLVKAISLRTTDMNTRVRKKSVDLINQIWEGTSSANQSSSANSSTLQGSALKNQPNKGEDSMSSGMVADVLCDPSLQDKAIAGRLGLFIKKAMMVESGQDLSKKSHKAHLGKDYEQLCEFACSWCLHKNTKVRASALKLIVELCRVNHIDPKGAPFKQRIANFVLGLRPSQAKPLVTKINEICAQEDQNELSATTKSAATTSEKRMRARNGEQKLYFDASMLGGLDLNQRAASMDRRQIKPSKNNQDMEGVKSGNNISENQTNLPSIGNASLPGIAQKQASGQGNWGGASGSQMPTIVLPHSEPLTEEQQKQAEPFLELFGSQIMTCFFSQTWSTRQACIQKVEEQLHNLDPSRRDAMLGEINRGNLPPEVSFRTFLQFIEEGFKDPVLKNYLMLLQLTQKALPIYFRFLKPPQIKSDLMPLIANILNKTSDLKSKVREASINFCLYLSHQSPVGPQVMINEVIRQLEGLLVEKKETKKEIDGSQVQSNSSTFGNSHQIASCVELLRQFQTQTHLVDSINSHLFRQYMIVVNAALKNSNPLVRKQAEKLYKQLFVDFGEEIKDKLVNQKAALVSKLVQEARTEASQAQSGDFKSPKIGDKAVQSKEEENKQQNLDKTMMQLHADLMSMPQVRDLLGDNRDEIVRCLKLPNAKKRQKTIIEIKKIIQQKMASLSGAGARELLEPLQLLLRELLKDENTDVYLEVLNLLKFIVGSLAPQLSALDLHLMIGQFVSLTLVKASSVNMRVRVASDKVVIFFAKHASIGSFIVSKEVLKNIERINRVIVGQAPASMTPEEVMADKNQKLEVLVRHFGVLQMLIQQFAIVLCYQSDFYVKCLELVAESMNLVQDMQQTLKAVCAQIIISFYEIDLKLLEQGVQKLDFTKKTPVRKVMIEYENQQQKGGKIQIATTGSGSEMTLQNLNATSNSNKLRLVAGNYNGDRSSEHSPDASLRDTQQSFASFNKSDRGSSPAGSGSTRRRQRVTAADFGGGGGMMGNGVGMGRSTIDHSEWSERRQTKQQVRTRSLRGSNPNFEEMRQTDQSWKASDRRINRGGITGTEGPIDLTGVGSNATAAGPASGSQRDSRVFTSKQMTGEKENSQAGGFLPEIGSGIKPNPNGSSGFRERRFSRPPISNDGADFSGRQGRAAGFKRDSEDMKASLGAKKIDFNRIGDGQQSSLPSSGGMASFGNNTSTVLDQKNKQSPSLLSSSNPSQTGSTYEPSSDKTAMRRSSQRRFGEGGISSDKPKANLNTLEPANLGPSRPPLYVPTRRDSQKRENIQESDFQKQKESGKANLSNQSVKQHKDVLLLGTRTDSPYQLKPDLLIAPVQETTSSLFDPMLSGTAIFGQNRGNSGSRINSNKVNPSAMVSLAQNLTDSPQKQLQLPSDAVVAAQKLSSKPPKSINLPPPAAVMKQVKTSNPKVVEYGASSTANRGISPQNSSQVQKRKDSLGPLGSLEPISHAADLSFKNQPTIQNKNANLTPSGGSNLPPPGLASFTVVKKNDEYGKGKKTTNQEYKPDIFM